MNISGEYGTELLLRYTDERLSRELEERRVANERAAELRRENGSRLSRFARFFFREEVAAGGPEWVRPNVQAEPDRRSELATQPVVPQEPGATLMGNGTERMPSRPLVGARR
jgi:hypothetical protein